MRIFSVLMILFSMSAVHASVQRPPTSEFAKAKVAVQSLYGVRGSLVTICFDTDGNDVMLNAVSSNSEKTDMKAIFNLGRIGSRPAVKDQVTRDASYINYSGVVDGRQVYVRIPFGGPQNPTPAKMTFGGLGDKTIICFDDRI